MSTVKPEREYFLDSIRAYLMLLGCRFTFPSSTLRRNGQ